MSTEKGAKVLELKETLSNPVEINTAEVIRNNPAFAALNFENFVPENFTPARYKKAVVDMVLVQDSTGRSYYRPMDGHHRIAKAHEFIYGNPEKNIEPHPDYVLYGEDITQLVLDEKFPGSEQTALTPSQYLKIVVDPAKKEMIDLRMAGHILAEGEGMLEQGNGHSAFSILNLLSSSSLNSKSLDMLQKLVENPANQTKGELRVRKLVKNEDSDDIPTLTKSIIDIASSIRKAKVSYKDVTESALEILQSSDDRNLVAKEVEGFFAYPELQRKIQDGDEISSEKKMRLKNHLVNTVIQLSGTQELRALNEILCEPSISYDETIQILATDQSEQADYGTTFMEKYQQVKLRSNVRHVRAILADGDTRYHFTDEHNMLMRNIVRGDSMAQKDAIKIANAIKNAVSEIQSADMYIDTLRADGATDVIDSLEKLKEQVLTSLSTGEIKVRISSLRRALEDLRNPDVAPSPVSRSATSATRIERTQEPPVVTTVFPKTPGDIEASTVAPVVEVRTETKIPDIFKEYAEKNPASIAALLVQFADTINPQTATIIEAFDKAQTEALALGIVMKPYYAEVNGSLNTLIARLVVLKKDIAAEKVKLDKDAALITALQNSLLSGSEVPTGDLRTAFLSLAQNIDTLLRREKDTKEPVIVDVLNGSEQTYKPLVNWSGVQLLEADGKADKWFNTRFSTKAKRPPADVNRQIVTKMGYADFRKASLVKGDIIQQWLDQTVIGEYQGLDAIYDNLSSHLGYAAAEAGWRRGSKPFAYCFGKGIDLALQSRIAELGQANIDVPKSLEGASREIQISLAGFNNSQLSRGPGYADALTIYFLTKSGDPLRKRAYYWIQSHDHSGVYADVAETKRSIADHYKTRNPDSDMDSMVILFRNAIHNKTND